MSVLIYCGIALALCLWPITYCELIIVLLVILVFALSAPFVNKYTNHTKSIYKNSILVCKFIVSHTNL